MKYSLFEGIWLSSKSPLKYLAGETYSVAIHTLYVCTLRTVGTMILYIHKGVPQCSWYNMVDCVQHAYIDTPQTHTNTYIPHEQTYRHTQNHAHVQTHTSP